MNIMTPEEREDIDGLLPWYAAGSLSRRDAKRVEVALSRDQELIRRYALVREELAETIHLNETLAAPSARVGERLLAAIEREGAPARRRWSLLRLWGWLGERLSGLGPRALAWSATVATLAFVVQAGLIADLGGTRSKLQGAPEPAKQGPYAFVTFVPQASAADITIFFRVHKVSVVDGPRADGIYKIHINAADRSKEELARSMAQIEQPNHVVRYIGRPAE